jgi:hypothetical protein
VKILLIDVVIAIVAGLYWLLRRSVLRDEQASRQRLKRGREAWRAGGGVAHPSGFGGGDYSGFYNTSGYRPGATEVATEAEAVATTEAAEAETIERARSA